MCMEHAQFARVMSHAAPPPRRRGITARTRRSGGVRVSRWHVRVRAARRHPPAVRRPRRRGVARRGDQRTAPRQGGELEFHDRVSPARVAESAVTTHVTFTVPPDRVSRSGRGRPPRLGTAGGTNGTT